MKKNGRIIQIKRNNTDGYLAPTGKDVVIYKKADVGGGYIYHSARRLTKDNIANQSSQVLEDYDLKSTGTVQRSHAQKSLTTQNKKHRH